MRFFSGVLVSTFFSLFLFGAAAFSEESALPNIADLIAQSESAQVDIQEVFAGLSPKDKKGICHHVKMQQLGKSEQELKYEQGMASALKQVEAMAKDFPEAQRQQLIAGIRKNIEATNPMFTQIIRQVQRGLVESVIDCSEVEAIVVQEKSTEMAGVEVIAIDD